MGYVFLATGLVAFIDTLQKNSMGVKEKIVIILMYLIKIGLSMITTLFLLLLKSSTHDSLGFVIWLSIILVKMICLFVFLLFKHEKEDSKFDLILSLVCNINVPVHLKPFEISGDTQTNNFCKLDHRLFMTWALSSFEVVVRSICILVFGGEEVYAKVLPKLTGIRLISGILLMEAILFILWNIFFRKLFIWRHLVDTSSGSSESNAFGTNEEEIKLKVERDEVKPVQDNSQSLNNLHLMVPLDVTIHDLSQNSKFYRRHSLHSINVTKINDKIEQISLQESDMNRPSKVTNCLNNIRKSFTLKNLRGSFKLKLTI